MELEEMEREREEIVARMDDFLAAVVEGAIVESLERRWEEVATAW